jgi:hypothetical protein
MYILETLLPGIILTLFRLRNTALFLTYFVFDIISENKSSFRLLTVHEDVLGSGGIAPCILALGTRWR